MHRNTQGAVPGVAGLSRCVAFPEQFRDWRSWRLNAVLFVTENPNSCCLTFKMHKTGEALEIGFEAFLSSVLCWPRH